jgi:hypothetical protein
MLRLVKPRLAVFPRDLIGNLAQLSNRPNLLAQPLSTENVSLDLVELLHKSWEFLRL